MNARGMSDIKQIPPAINNTASDTKNPTCCSKERWKTRGICCGSFLLAFLASGLLLLSTTWPLLFNYAIKSEGIPRPLWWKNAINNSKVAGQDGAQSFQLPDGSSMWIFGDTVLNCSECGWGWKMITNSAILLRIENETVIEAVYPSDDEGFARQIVPYQSDEEASAYGIWPGAGISVGNTVYVAWETINRGNGPWGFSHYAYGQGYQDFTNFTSFLDTVNITRLYPDSTTSNVLIGDSLIYEDYVYHYVITDTPAFRDIKIARIRTDQIHAFPQQLQFFTGNGWFSIPVEEASTIISFQGAQCSVKWNDYLGQFVSTSVGLVGDIYFLTAPYPWGPWSWPVRVYTVPKELRAGSLIYAVYLHQELFREGGRVMVFTYCLTPGGDGLPYMAEVTLDKL